MPNDVEPKCVPSPATSVELSLDADDVTVPERVPDDDDVTEAASPTKTVYCTSAGCRLDQHSERELFDHEVSSVPRRSLRLPRNSVNLVNIDEHQL